MESISVSNLKAHLSAELKASGAFPVVVKTLDALHLASALVFSETVGHETVLIFSHDAGLNRCAAALGFSVPFG